MNTHRSHLRFSRSLRSAQRGVSMGAVMIVLVLIVFFANLAISMAPSYLTFMQVRGLMDGLAEKPEVLDGGPRKIMGALSSQLNVNGIRSIKSSDFKLSKVDDELQLAVDYEVRKHLFFNVDVVMHFAHATILDAT